jgi:hypothetical protein
MPMTRHPVRSSFTFEIKRANRRAPEVLTRSKTSSPERSFLADQVFGKLPAQPRASQPSQIDVPASVQPAPVFGTNSRKVSVTTEPSAEKSVRRVLPDLLSPVTPLEQRVQYEAEERAVRRRAPRTTRVKKEAERSSVAAAREDAPSTLAVTLEPVVAKSHLPEAVTTLPQEADQSIEQVTPSQQRKRNILPTVFRKAERAGRPLPLLPAGQCWKRRLPKACW